MFANFFDRPHVELAFDSLRIGVLGCVEPAERVAKVAKDVVDGLVECLAESRFASELPCVQIDASEKRLVVEHLFEVRNEPASICGVSSEAATEMVVDATCGHGIE